jgi:hypothetical protein
MSFYWRDMGLALSGGVGVAYLIPLLALGYTPEIPGMSLRFAAP